MYCVTHYNIEYNIILKQLNTLNLSYDFYKFFEY